MGAYDVREVETHTTIAGTIMDFGVLGSFFSENGSTRGVLIDGTAAIFNDCNSSDRYLIDSMLCARAIDDTAVKHLQ